MFILESYLNESHINNIDTNFDSDMRKEILESYENNIIDLDYLTEMFKFMESENLNEGSNKDYKNAVKSCTSTVSINIKLAKKAIKRGDKDKAKKCLSEASNAIAKCKKEIEKIDEYSGIGSVLIGSYAFAFSQMGKLILGCITIIGLPVVLFKTLKDGIMTNIKTLTEIINTIKNDKKFNVNTLNIYRNKFLAILDSYDKQLKKIKSQL